MLCVSINQHATAEISKFGGRRSTTISTAPLIFTCRTNNPWIVMHQPYRYSHMLGTRLAVAGVPIGRRSENKCWPKSSGPGPNNDGTKHAASACICFEIDLVSADKNNHDSFEIDWVSADMNHHDNIFCLEVIIIR